MEITVEIESQHKDEFNRVFGRELTADDIVKYAENAVTVKRNKDIYLAFQSEVINGHDWSDEALLKYMKEDIFDHNAGPDDAPGFEGFRSRYLQWAESFHDGTQVNEVLIGEGEVLAVLYNTHAEHKGTFMGIEPTDKHVVIPGIEFVRFEDGKIVERWGIYDYFSTAEEIGANITFTPRTYEIPRGKPLPWGGPPVDEESPKRYTPGLA